MVRQELEGTLSNLIIPIKSMGGRHYHSHITDIQTEAQG